MNKSLWKDNLREIRKTFPRFLSIFAIIALGVAFFIGIRAAGPSMIQTAENYYRDFNMPDGYVQSTFALTESDMDEFEKMANTDWFPISSIFAKLAPGDESIKLYTAPSEQSQNFFEIVEGRMVTDPSEIVLDFKYLNSVDIATQSTIKLGDTVTLDLVEETNNPISINNQQFTVVGFAKTPLYMERARRGPNYNSFGIVVDEVIDSEIYTEAYFWNRTVEDLAPSSAQYHQKMDKMIGELEQVTGDRAIVRQEEIQSEIQDEIVKGHEELETGYQELKQGQQDLVNGQAEIDKNFDRLVSSKIKLIDGEMSMIEGHDELQSGLRDYQLGRYQLMDGQMKILSAEQKYLAGLEKYKQGQLKFDQEINQAESRLFQGQAEIDQGYEEANLGYQQLFEGQMAINEGYAQVEAGRQELVNQIGLALQDQIDPNELLLAIGNQTDNLNTIIEQLMNNTEGNPNLQTWLAALEREEESLGQYYDQIKLLGQELNNFQEDLLATNVLSQSEIDQLNQLWNLNINDQISVADTLTILKHVETNLKQNIENSILESNSLNSSHLTTEEIQARIEQIQEKISQLKEEIEKNESSPVETPPSSDGQQEELMLIEEQIQAIESSLSEINSAKNQDNLSEEELASLSERENQLIDEKLRLEKEAQLYDIPEKQDEGVNPIDSDLKLLLEEIQTQENQLVSWQEILDSMISIEYLNELDIEQYLDKLPSDSPILKHAQDLMTLRDAIGKLEAAQAELDARNQELQAGWDEYYQGLNQLKEAQEQLNQGWAEFENQKLIGQASLNAAWQELTEARKLIDNGYKEGKNGWAQLIRGKFDLDQGYFSYNSGNEEIFKGNQDLLEGSLELVRSAYVVEAGLNEFTKNAQEAIVDLRKGQLKLTSAEHEAGNLAKPNYIITDRSSMPSYQSIYDNAYQLDTIANIFPIFFIAIAILVTYTTIKRMASEQRNYIGTMKQMGYSNGAVISKFVSYAGLASLIGIIVGLILGYLVFPPVIIGAYNIMYYFNEAEYRILWDWNIIASIIAFLTAMIPAINTPLKILRHAPSQLLIPESPKSGKAILLEKLTFIWSRIDFYQKLTVRNLFRYKGRNLMTIIGIAGCTMLTLTGFGISDTLKNMATTQFEQIQTFDSMIVLGTNISDKDAESAFEQIDQIKGIKKMIPTHLETVKVELPQGQIQMANIIVPLDESQNFNEYVSVQERGDQGSQYPDGQVYVTERLAEMLGYQVNDPIKFKNENHQDYQITQAKIAENYVQHYIYMTPDFYRQLMNQEPTLNNIFTLYHDGVNRIQLEKEINQQSNVQSTIDIQMFSGSVLDAMSSLDLITIVLIISAAALSFVVLYNLTNINVSERIRELSTIKVLGFFDIEVSMYIFNEILIITFLGSLLGLGMGKWLTFYIMKTMQTNELLFYPVINLSSYLISFFISFVFSTIVMVAMHWKLKEVDMVEALKAVD